MRMTRVAGGLLTLAALWLWPVAAVAQANWPTYGGNDWNQRWSTLTQINTRNVNKLVPRMVFQTNVSKLGSFENTPIVIDGMMYVTTAYNEATIAYDLATRKQVWRYEHKLGTTITCCGPNNRGVAVSNGLVIEGTMDMMWQSLLKLRALPDDTRLFCGHEYTQANCRFAVVIEPENQMLRKRTDQVTQLVGRGEPTIPTTLAEEKAVNPFLRADVPSVAAGVDLKGADPAKVFAAVRARKDRF